jgi:hypothetical protein
VPDELDGGAELIEVAGAWRGTRIPRAVVARAEAADAPARVPQEVRLRVLRALSA